MRIKNKAKNNFIAQNVQKADTYRTRFIGLLNRKSISSEEALIITRCNSIHMFFMKFAIDVIFVSKSDRVVGLVKNIPPFGLSPVFFKASYCIECSVGTIDLKDVEIGDEIEIVN